MKTLLLLGALLFLPLVAAALVSASATDQCVSFAVMPSAKRASTALSSKADRAASKSTGSTSSTSRAKKQKLKPEDSAPVASGDELVRISRRLHDRLKDQTWRGTSKQPVTCSYDVLEYASETNEAYTQRYGGGRPLGRAFVVGMNPGPWGMVQTGVPFGEVSFVRDWLEIRGEVGRPRKEHAKRPVDGFGCKRSEVSGTRLWGFFERRFGTADAWGDKMFVYNYCPLTFMSSSGGNITPDKLTPAERKVIDDACGDALADMMSALKPSVVVAVGNFAGSKCLEAVRAAGLGAGEGEREVEVVVVNHPSPASPTGVRWKGAACLNELVLKSSKSKEIDQFLL